MTGDSREFDVPSREHRGAWVIADKSKEIRLLVVGVEHLQRDWILKVIACSAVGDVRRQQVDRQEAVDTGRRGLARAQARRTAANMILARITHGFGAVD